MAISFVFACFLYNKDLNDSLIQNSSLCLLGSVREAKFTMYDRHQCR